MVEISGPAPPGLAAVKDALATNFEAGEELGARFNPVESGDVVLDLWAGFADRRLTLAFDTRTSAPVFSTTNAIAAPLIAWLADQCKLAYDQTVDSVWPAFG